MWLSIIIAIPDNCAEVDETAEVDSDDVPVCDECEDEYALDVVSEECVSKLYRLFIMRYWELFFLECLRFWIYNHVETETTCLSMLSIFTFQ